MGPLLFRLALLAVGLGLTEIGITALVSASPAFWLLLPFGLLALIAGGAGFMGPLLGANHEKEGR
jgi:hypothetical protein